MTTRLDELIEVLWEALDDECPERSTESNEHLAARLASLVQDQVNL